MDLSVAVVLSVRIARSVQSIRQEHSMTEPDDAAASTHDRTYDDPLTSEDVRDYRLHLISRGDVALVAVSY